MPEPIAASFPIRLPAIPAGPIPSSTKALRATGEFTLVSEPAQADLILVRFVSPIGPYSGAIAPIERTWEGNPLPMFRLVIYDRKTHYILWTCTQSVEYAVMQKSHDKNFDAAVSAILQQFLQVAGNAPGQTGSTSGTH
jgi:hypothetical protein